jgi:CBS domain-containing protein
MHSLFTFFDPQPLFDRRRLEVKEYMVKDLMIPLSEYATVSEEATLSEAVMALEKAQKDFDSSRYRHRAILVLDKAGAVVGKLSQLDALRALEPKYEEMQESGGFHRYGFSRKFMKSLLEKTYRLWDSPLDDICRKACTVKITRYMHRPTEGEFVEEDATLNEAIHQLVLGCQQSLLVTRGKKIVGIIRLTDVFATVSEAIRQCTISTDECSE